MSDYIQDGKGNGYRAGVNNENRLMVQSVSDVRAHHIAHVHRQAYNARFNVTPSGAGSCFFYLKNNSQTLDVIIWDIYVRMAGNEYFDIKTGVTGTAVGTACSCANQYIGTGNIADITSATGNGITGLSGGDVNTRFYIPADNETKLLSSRTGIIIPAAQTFALYAGNGSINIEMTVQFEMHSLEA